MRNPSVRLGAGILFAALLGLVAPAAQATSVQHRNIVDLIDLSEIILTGRVLQVTDGFEGGVPFTEVRVETDEVLRGTVGGVYIFRQFGLLAPRNAEGARRFVAVSPEGWPQFEKGEQVMLFLYKPGAKTGLRTTVGLLQGKFRQRNGGFVNGIDNQGLFQNVAVDPGLLDPAEEGLLHRTAGPMPADAFRSFVRKAVSRRWVEDRRLTRAQ